MLIGCLGSGIKRSFIQLYSLVHVFFFFFFFPTEHVAVKQINGITGAGKLFLT